MGYNNPIHKSIYDKSYRINNKEDIRLRKLKWERNKRAFLSKEVDKIKEEHGGRCQICGYNKNYAALAFHSNEPQAHVTITKLIFQKRSPTKAREEAKKCMLICFNCHQEIHNPHKIRNIQ